MSAARDALLAALEDPETLAAVKKRLGIDEAPAPASARRVALLLRQISKLGRQLAATLDEASGAGEADPREGR